MNIYIQKLENISIQNKYLTWYTNIILAAHNRQFENDVYFELHHILPKCCKEGGETDIQNIIKLTPREHLICHRLLVKFIAPKQIKASLAYAAWQMGTFMSEKRGVKINSRLYESLRKSLSENTKNIPKSEQHKQNMRKPKSNTENMGAPKGSISCMFNKHHTEETKNLIGKKAKERYSIKENCPFYGKHHTEESKEKRRITIDEKYGENKPWLTQESIQKRANKLKGTVPHNAQSVTYNGITHSSILQCALANGVSKYMMRKLLKEHNN